MAPMAPIAARNELAPRIFCLHGPCCQMSSPLMRGTHLVAILVVLAACGGSVETSPPATAGSAIEAACNQLARARAEFVATCDGYTLSETSFAESCVGLATLPGIPDSAAPITSCTRLVLDGTPRCEAPSCADTWNPPLATGHDQRGSKSPGEPCVANRQCSSGYCSALGSEVPCGVCQILRKPNEPCTSAQDLCVPPDDMPGEVVQCVDGLCQFPGKTKGEACIDYARECQANLYCKRFVGDGLEGTCEPSLPPDGTCTPSDRCASPNTCLDGRCQIPPPPVTTPAPSLAAEGQDCSNTVCEGGLFCSPERVCRRPRSGIQLGERCGPDAVCAQGLACHSACSDGSCPVCTDVGPGQPCAFGSCRRDARCEGLDATHPGVCKKLGDEGEACPCLHHLACVDGQCVPFGASVCR